MIAMVNKELEWDHGQQRHGILHRGQYRSDHGQEGWSRGTLRSFVRRTPGMRLRTVLRELHEIRNAMEATFKNEVGIKNAEVEQEELRGETKNKFILRVTTAPLLIFGKTMVAVYIEDITEQKRMQTAILMANKKMNLLGSVTRHDTVNQLSVLMGNLEIASMKNPKISIDQVSEEGHQSGENIATILLSPRTTNSWEPRPRR